MALKYDQLDAKLFSWLGRNRQGVTTAHAIKALRVQGTTAKRHVSRRFSQLEDRGVLVCKLQGTTRVCKIVGAVPQTLAKRQPQTPTKKPLNQQIAANDSAEFLAAGGQIQRLPAAWDDPEGNAPKGSLPLGDGYAMPSAGMESFD